MIGLDLIESSNKVWIFDKAGIYFWSRPKGINMYYILCIGAGGGGGGGTSGASGTTRSGGGGGGSGAINRAVIPSIFLPDSLYLTVGQGGTAGSSNGNGGSGGLSSIDVTTTTSAIPASRIIQSGTLASVGGLAAGTGGNGSTAATAALSNYTTLSGGFSLVVGQSGSNANVNLTFGASLSLFISGGAGGGTATSVADNIGSPIVSSGILKETINGGSTGGGNGRNGISSYNPIFFVGGSGAGSNRVGTGGNGGDGANGCGGGGGGAGVTGGLGGRGGDGLIVIVGF
jgi:hypothetical protein